MSDLLHFETCDGRDPCSCDREAALLPRLTTAEQEREEYASEYRVEAQRRRVAEARVEALEAEVAELTLAGTSRAFAYLAEKELRQLHEARTATLTEALADATAFKDVRALDRARELLGLPDLNARAALACPPQQRGE